jgi:hypothetical protein
VAQPGKFSLKKIKIKIGPSRPPGSEENSSSHCWFFFQKIK